MKSVKQTYKEPKKDENCKVFRCGSGPVHVCVVVASVIASLKKGEVVI